MAEIIKCYKERLPALRFIGKKYTDKDRVYGGFGAKWGEWFQNGWFDELEKLGVLSENGNAYLGLMKWAEGSFEYWIGIFFPENTLVPEGYGYVDFIGSDIGTCWIYGFEQNDNIYGMHDECVAKMMEEGFDFQDDFGDGNKQFWFFERYNCPRFTTPDENGKIILDYCFYIK